MEFRVENPQGMHVFKQMGEIAVELRIESGARYYTRVHRSTAHPT